MTRDNTPESIVLEDHTFCAWLIPPMLHENIRNCFLTFESSEQLKSCQAYMRVASDTCALCICLQVSASGTEPKRPPNLREDELSCKGFEGEVNKVSAEATS